MRETYEESSQKPLKNCKSIAIKFLSPFLKIGEITDNFQTSGKDSFFKIILTVAQSWKWFILLNTTVSSLCLVIARDFVNEEFVYSVTACKKEYLTKYRDLMIQETSLKAHTRDVINRFVQTGSINKGKSRGRLRQLLMIWDDLSRMEQLNTGSKVLTKGCYRTFLKFKREWTCALNRMINIFNFSVMFNRNK